MSGPPDNLEPHGSLPFVCPHGLHPARLTDNRTKGLLAQARQRRDEMRYATATRLLVIGECKMHRPLQVYGGKLRQGGQRAGEKSLHIGGTATVKPVAIAAQNEWICPPFRFTGWYDIHMSR